MKEKSEKNVENLTSDEQVPDHSKDSSETNNTPENDDMLPIIATRARDKLKMKDTEQKIAEIQRVKIDDLVPFKCHPFQTYEGERLEKLADSIKETGLQNPIVVRPHKNKTGKYEILSGHNRVEAARLLGWNTIEAIIKRDLPDEMAERIVVESNLNQQSFSDWKYSQQIKVIKIYSKHLQEHSQQGKRNDLRDNPTDASTCVHSEHKSDDKTKRPKTRDKISKQLGISSTVFERYKNIAKLNDEVLALICVMLDEKRLGFMSAHRISQLKPGEIKSVADFLKNNKEINLKGTNVKSLYDKSRESKEADLPKDVIKDILLFVD